MAKGHQLPPPELSPGIAPALVAPGIIIRTSVNLGEQDRLIQFETFCDRDETEPEINHRCDVMMRAADRLRAHHLLPSYRRNREDAEYKHNDNRARKAEVVARLSAMDEARAEKIAELEKQMSAAITNARDEHVASGRRGEFRVPASIKSRFEGQIEQVRAGGDKEHAETKMQLSTLENELKEGERALFKWDQLITELEALAKDAANEK